MKKTKQIQEKNRLFFNRATLFYEIGFVKRINLIIHKKVFKSVLIKDNSDILDSGCGTGTFLELISRKKKNIKNRGIRLHGIDISEKMLKAAKKRLGKKAKLYIQSVEGMEFDSCFDYIFNIDSFHHYADQKKAMANFYKALKKDGKLIIIDFSFGMLGNKIFKKLEPGNSKMYLKSEFRQLFKKHKFKNIKQKRLGLFSILTTGKKQQKLN